DRHTVTTRVPLKRRGVRPASKNDATATRRRSQHPHVHRLVPRLRLQPLRRPSRVINHGAQRPRQPLAPAAQRRRNRYTATDGGLRASNRPIGERLHRTPITSRSAPRTRNRRPRRVTHHLARLREHLRHIHTRHVRNGVLSLHSRSQHRRPNRALPGRVEVIRHPRPRTPHRRQRGTLLPTNLSREPSRRPRRQHRPSPPAAPGTGPAPRPASSPSPAAHPTVTARTPQRSTGTGSRPGASSAAHP